MSIIHTEDVLLLAIVTILGVGQLANFALRTGKARKKYKISYPTITGNPDFERVFRAQQNTLEFFPMFMGALWVAGIFFNQVPVALVGLLYLYARMQYFSGYSKSVEGRLPGFYLSGRALYALLAMSIVGLTQAVFLEYLHINLKVKLLHMYYGARY